MGSGNIKESRHTNGKICGNETRLQMIISSGRKGSHVNTIIPARAAIKPYRVTDCKEKAYMLQEGAVFLANEKPQQYKNCICLYSLLCGSNSRNTGWIYLVIDPEILAVLM